MCDAAPRLDVYVSAECPNCGEAVRLAEEAATRYPHAVVRVVDLDQLGGNPPPDPVVAVPTYVLNGQVVSLGNPSRALRSSAPAAWLVLSLVLGSRGRDRRRRRLRVAMGSWRWPACEVVA